MTSQPIKNFTLNDVRNVSENTIGAFSMPITKDVILEILTLLDALIEYKSNEDKYTDLAERLSKVAGKSPPWSWRYVQSVASGTVEPSKKFANAVNTLAVTFDGIPVPFAKASPVTVYAETGTISDGAFVMAESVRCANPTCTVVFVPNVPWRKYCPVCRPRTEME